MPNPLSQLDILPRTEFGKKLAKALRRPEFGAKAYSLGELSNTYLERPSVLVDNILREGETVALVARPKTGKTRLAQQLAVALALGNGHFLGQKVRKQARILYIDLESAPVDARDRLQKIA